MQQPLWQPTAEQIEQSQLYQFMQQLNQRYALQLDSYEDLYHWSLQQPENFWYEIWQQLGVIGELGKPPYLIDGAKMPGAKWFNQAKLNYAENLLRYRDEQPALIFRNETDQRTEISYQQLHLQVSQFASALKASGIEKGDVVAGWLPNLPETVVAMLATTSLGAVWTSCSPDFGINGVIERFGQVNPKILIATDRYLYNGKEHSYLPRIEQVCQQLPSLQKLVMVPYLAAAVELPNDSRAVALTEFQAQFQTKQETTLQFQPVNFNDPLFIMYSSGTTGKPKCIVHGVGGTLLQHLKEHQLHTDLQRSDRLFYYTTCGWMMWNWLVSGLASGSTLVLYDGAPMAPKTDQLWRLCEEEQISIMGLSAKYLSALENLGVKPKQQYQLKALRAVLSTGSPLSAESFHYVYRDIKQQLMLSSISGGTDIISCFALGCPIRPVYAGELQCRGLGMAVEVYDQQGEICNSGKGELICKHPFPSMPIYFWGDNKGERYHNAYFAKYPNIWAHGDFAARTKHDGLIIYGRSDAVLNPGGVRIGTADIYRQLERIAAIQDAVCIGQPWQDDCRIVLFVVLKPETELDETLKQQIRQEIVSHCSPKHRPEKIIQVTDIPRTISGKTAELAVRKMVMGETVENRDALANPEALEQFAGIEELNF